MSDFGKKLRNIRLERSMTQDEFAALLGTSKQVISRYENNQRSPKISVAAEYARRLGVPLSALNDDDSSAVHPSGVIPIRRARIPVLGSIAAGRPILATEQYDTYIEADEDIDCSYALRVDGDSMEPTIRYGDLVFIRQQDDVDDGEIAAVLIDDSATLKRVTHIANGVTLFSDNAAKYSPMTFTYPECDVIRILGKAVAFKRML